MQTRRSLIQRGVIGGALLFASGGAFWFRKSIVEGSHLDPTGFRGGQRDVLRAMARRILVVGAGAPSVDEIDVVARCEAALKLLDAKSQEELLQVIGLFESAWVNFVLGGRLQSFAAMSEQQQDQVLNEWSTSRLKLRRSGFQALRSLIASAYYGDERTWASVGYAGPPTGFHNPQAPVWKGPDSPSHDAADAPDEVH